MVEVISRMTTVIRRKINTGRVSAVATSTIRIYIISDAKQTTPEQDGALEVRGVGVKAHRRMARPERQRTNSCMPIV